MIKIVSLFSGVGGIDLGFNRDYSETILLNDIDNNAIKTLKSNFENEKVKKCSIKDINPKHIPEHDILLAGFPCQAFSIAGYRKGFEDERGDLFFDVLKIIKEKKPRVVFLENVKNLVSHDGGNTFSVIIEALEKNGYYVKYAVLNAKDYGGIPQNRERIYIVAFRLKKDYEKFYFPKPKPLEISIEDIVKYDLKVDEKYYIKRNNFKNYDIIMEYKFKKNTIYQWRRKYVRENKSNVCPTLTANMGTGGHNVPLVYTKYGLRKLTPRECFDFQGFPKSFKMSDVADCHLYKQAGNSVVVTVIERIATEIYKVIC